MSTKDRWSDIPEEERTPRQHAWVLAQQLHLTGFELRADGHMVRLTPTPKAITLPIAGEGEGAAG